MTPPKNDGGPVFPTSTWEIDDGVQIGTPTAGLSKREYFAAAALQGLIIKGAAIPRVGTVEIPYCVEEAFALADWMLAESEKLK